MIRWMVRWIVQWIIQNPIESGPWIKDGMGVDKHARYFGRQNNMSNSHVRSEPNPPPPTQFCVWTWS